MAIKVQLLTQWFEPEPAFKGLSFAKALRDQGLDVEVVTGFPNYPGGKLYPGYKVRLIQREVVDGIRVTRLPLYPSHDNSGRRRAANYISFAVSTALYGLFRWHKPDVIYAYHPPLTVGCSASVIGLLRRVPIVLDVQDMWPDTLRATGMISSDKVLSTVGKVCQWVYRRCARIVVLSDGFKRLLQERGVPAERIRVIPNWCEERQLAAPTGAAPAGFPGPDKFRILFAGNLGKAQALDTVLDAAERLRQQAPDIVFVLMGGGVEVERLREAIRTRGLSNVMLLPPVPMSEVGAALAEADALLVHLRDDPLFTITIPSKTQAYMAVGKPILMGVRGDAADLVQRAECGVLFEPENPDALAQAAVTLSRLPLESRRLLGVSGARYYADHLSLSSGARAFAEVFRAVLGR
jgi:glycosyltransferase involved in cell wall biosynthesis